MPLYLRQIWPIDVGRKYYPESETYYRRSNREKTDKDDTIKKDSAKLVDTLEEFSNRTMCNIIRQLADLGKKSHEIFENLENEGNMLHGRVKSMSRRLEFVTQNVERLIADDDKEHKINLEEKPQVESGDPWKSTFQADAGFFTPASRTLAIKQMYNCCEEMPHLKILQDYRLDNQNCVKLYSDPDMFFNIWKEELIKEAKRARTEKKNKKSADKSMAGPDRKQVQLAKIKTRREQIAERELLAGNVLYNNNNNNSNSNSSNTNTLTNNKEVKFAVSKSETFDSIDANNQRPKYDTQDSFEQENSYENEEDDYFPPPPEDINEGPRFRVPQPPSPDLDYPSPWTPSNQVEMPPKFSIPTMSPPKPPLSLTIPAQNSFDSATSSLPEPPTPPVQVPKPPPPPLLMGPPPPPLPPLLNQPQGNLVTNKTDNVQKEGLNMGNFAKQLQQGVSLKKVVVNDDVTELDDRSDLLKQIRNGKQLKKVTVCDTKNDKNRREAKQSNNVAELMMQYVDQRYLAVHGSDTEDSDDNEEMFEDNDFD